MVAFGANLRRARITNGDFYGTRGLLLWRHERMLSGDDVRMVHLLPIGLKKALPGFSAYPDLLFYTYRGRLGAIPFALSLRRDFGSDAELRGFLRALDVDARVT